MKNYRLDDFMVKPEGKLAKRMIYKDSQVIAFILNIAPGQSLPPHTHFTSTLLLQVLSGNGVLHVDGQPFALAEKQLVQLEGPEKMSVYNTGEQTLVLYVTISPNPPAEGYSVDADL
jgi:quercetin dioxygenase-like cupin family protein